MVLPGVVAVLAPPVIGFTLGAEALAGALASAMIVGAVLSLFMANAGGAWDNAKKFIEAGRLEGEKKRSEAHKAAVVGDTVGDPFKDTSGPGIAILIKVMSVVSLLIATSLPMSGTPDPALAAAAAAAAAPASCAALAAAAAASCAKASGSGKMSCVRHSAACGGGGGVQAGRRGGSNVAAAACAATKPCGGKRASANAPQGPAEWARAARHRRRDAWPPPPRAGTARTAS
jgi:hypothetical protein